MAQKTVVIRRNSDGTMTIRVGRNVEHISCDKSKLELFDHVKYAIISKGINLRDIDIAELINRA